MTVETGPALVKTPEKRPEPLAGSMGAFLSLPLRFKITLPYLVVAILLAGLATWVITQSFVNRLQERFNVQLVDNFETASTVIFQSESRALIAERAIARTAGVAEALTARDTSGLDTLIRPLAVNAHSSLVEVLDGSGTLVYGLHLTPNGNLRDQPAIDFSSWVSVRRVLAGESDELGDKFSSIEDSPDGPALYVAGPLLLNGRRVGVVLVGYPLGAILPQMITDSSAQFTVYRPDGQAILSTFPQGSQMPSLNARIMAAINTDGPHLLQNRIWKLGPDEYNEAIGPLLVRGQPTGWAIAVALPRTLVTNSTDISPWQLAVAFALAVLAVIALGVIVAKIIAIPVFELVSASTRVAGGDLDVNVREQARDELGLLSKQFNHMVSQLRQREVMRDLFGRMVSEEVRESLLLGDQLQLGGELKTVSVLFTDIRQFTTFSENHSPKEVVGMLNNYFSIVNDAVRQAGGMINKFGGDSTMAIFGAPMNLQPSESAHRALRAALSIRIQITEANARRVQAGLEPLNIGIGINTGEVITGNIGAEDRFEYTVIGDTVNVAARMQTLSAQYTDSNIFITRATYQAFNQRERLLVTDLGEMPLKGRTELVHVYSLIGMRLAKSVAKTSTPSRRNEVPRRDALETVYLYCRGFDPITIAAAKNLSLETVQAWIRQAASRFERSKRELRLEFHMTEKELKRLQDANPANRPATQLLELDISPYEHAT